MRIYIYGTGSSASSYYESIGKKRSSVVGFLDSDRIKQGNMFYNLPVCHIDALSPDEYDEIHIASVHLEIIDFLLERNIEKEKIVLVNPTLEMKYINAHDLFGGVRLSSEYVLMAKMAYNQNLELERFFYWRDIFGKENSALSYDYCRCKTAQLLSEEMIKNGVQGDLAELGVAQGDFARLLNSLFPERQLDLFDTFDGFDEQDKNFELEQGYTQESFFKLVDDFKASNEEMVLQRMPFPKSCRIHKGKFPDTTRDLKEKRYALVSIDCDLYVPILEGLKYFYPRVNEGGYIMLHDYNHVQFLGVKQAVQECERLFGRMHKVPISDQGGTLVISK